MNFLVQEQIWLRDNYPPFDAPLEQMVEYLRRERAFEHEKRREEKSLGRENFRKIFNDLFRVYSRIRPNNQ